MYFVVYDFIQLFQIYTSLLKLMGGPVRVTTLPSAIVTALTTPSGGTPPTASITGTEIETGEVSENLKGK